MMDRGAAWKWGGLVAVMALGLFVAWRWPQWQARAHAGSAYAARITCSCRYIEGRTAQSCARDVAGDAALISIADDTDTQRVTGSVFLLGRASARFRPGFGCLMEPVQAPVPR
jgi:hypothetical protein